MPPAGKGKGKKTRGGGTLGSNTNLHQRRSRSRNTSPSPATAVSDTTFSSADMTSYQDIVDRYLTGDSGIPTAVTLHHLTNDLKNMQENVKRRLALYEESVKSLDLKIMQKQDDLRKMRKADDDAKERRQRAAEEARKGKSPKKDGEKIKKKHLFYFDPSSNKVVRIGTSELHAGSRQSGSYYSEQVVMEIQNPQEQAELELDGDTGRGYFIIPSKTSSRTTRIPVKLIMFSSSKTAGEWRMGIMHPSTNRKALIDYINQ